MNFFLAWVAALLLPAPQAMAGSSMGYMDAAIAQNPLVGLFLFYFMLTNLVLGLFNLLPFRRWMAAVLPSGCCHSRWRVLGAGRALRHRSGDCGRFCVAASDPRLRPVRRSARDSGAVGDQSAAVVVRP